jgi:hypothetical protein
VSCILLCSDLHVPFPLEGPGVVRQADAHEVTGKGLSQVLTVGRPQPQPRAARSSELVQERLGERVQVVEVHGRPGQGWFLLPLMQQ